MATACLPLFLANAHPGKKDPVPLIGMEGKGSRNVRDGFLALLKGGGGLVVIDSLGNVLVTWVTPCAGKDAC